MQKTLTVIFDGNVFRPEEPVDLEPNARYRITIEAEPPGVERPTNHTLQWILEHATDMGLPDFAGPCTPNLRIIPIAQKPDKIVSFPHHVRRLCHDTTPLLLSTGDLGPGVVVRHAAPPLANPIQWPTQEAS